MDRAAIIHKFKTDKWIAHEALFGPRHSDPTPSFHKEIIEHWHDDTFERVFVCFRGSAKTTRSEEAFAICALLQEFENGLILGENQPRAIEKLQAIKHELETNERIIELFGYQQGPIWRDTKIVLANGVCIQAIGSGQGMRGTKHYSARPDCLLVDDVEGDKDASTPEQRADTRKWFFGTVLPACAPPGRRRVRVTGTPLDAESLVIELPKLSGWGSIVVPIKHIDDSGEWVSSWPERFPIEAIDKIEDEYNAIGEASTFSREYMCQPVSEHDRTFKSQMFRSEIITRSYQPVYAMYDPARTVNRRSAHTGKVVWSWIDGRLVVWESGGYFWLPDAIVQDVFETNTKYRPVTIGVERDGLEEFILQPLRHRALGRGDVIPLLGMKAPHGKDDFIKQLQPFFKAQEVIFVGDGHEQLKSQLLSFPTGRKDIPNALAYALILKPGQSVYKFFETHIAHTLSDSPSDPLWALVHGDARVTVAVLAQYHRGAYHILFDAVHEGTPAQIIPDLMREISLEAGRSFKTLVPESHYGLRDIVGLRPALRAMRIEPFKGGDRAKGIPELHDALRRNAQFKVHPKASWTIRAISSGYTVNTTDGPYFFIAQAIESFCARAIMSQQQEENINYAETRDGRQYISALP